MFEERMPAIQSHEVHELAGATEQPEGQAVSGERPARPEGFQLPFGIWKAMFALYAVFIVALAVATGGDGYARMVIAISALFMMIYFVIAAILSALAGVDRVQVREGRPLQTIYGPLQAREVWAQVLIIPAALALFGVGILIVTSMVGI